MNKRLIKSCIGAVLCTLIAGLSFTSVHAAEVPTVIYQGDEHRFRTESAAPYADNELVDLFPEFKDVMPGDTLTQNVTVKVQNMKKGKVSIKLSSLKDNADYQTGVSADRISLTVTHGTRDYTGTLKNGVELGTFAEGAQENIVVKLTLGAEVTDKDIENLRAEINWLFEAEELPSETNNGKYESNNNGLINKVVSAVKTGDANNLILWISLVVLSAIVVFLLFIARKVRRR
ncbi:MAG: hypothetical protein EOM40_07140 [Clostridia bacterium]|nr:hypothetical protein [Clostridia bacterium]NCC42337.1 hypothetical protein [Clostridia bacterium]